MDTPKNRVRLYIGLILIYIAGMIGMVVALQYVTVFIDYTALPDHEFVIFSTLSQLVLYGFWTIVMILYARKDLKYEISIFKEHPKRNFGFLGLGLYLTAAMMIIVGAWFFILDVVEPISENQLGLEQIFEGPWYALIMLFVFVVLLAPFVEELVFRKAIYGLINRRFNHIISIFMSALIFALVHLVTEIETVFVQGDWSSMIAAPRYLGMGLVISYVYFLSGKRLFVVVGLHAIYNLFAFMMMVI